MRAARVFPFLLVMIATAAGADETAGARGAAYLAPFKSQLQQALQQGLEQGPVEAIRACRVEAPRIAGALSRDGVRMGRVSHKLRNPANGEPAWARAVLEAYLADPAVRAPRVVSVAPDRTGYVEPIVTQPLCVTCHGEAIAPEVASLLAELYPNDRAVGFRPGDLRGVFWVEFPAAP